MLWLGKPHSEQDKVGELQVTCSLWLAGMSLREMIAAWAFGSSTKSSLQVYPGNYLYFRDQMSKKLSLAWVIPFLCFVFGYLGTYFFVQQNSIITPNVIGKGMQESAQLLSKHRLGVRLLKELEDSSLPEGVVMDQFPRGGDKIRPNQDIFITVSKKPRMFLTPDFLCLKQKDILAIAAKNGIDVNEVPIFSHYPVNTCIAQNPKPLVDMSRRRIVACISRGVFPLVIVPNFKGAQIQDIKTFLHQYDIKFDIVGTSTSSETGRVIEQSPVTGSIIAVDRPIQIQLRVE